MTPQVYQSPLFQGLAMLQAEVEGFDSMPTQMPAYLDQFEDDEEF